MVMNSAVVDRKKHGKMETNKHEKHCLQTERKSLFTNVVAQRKDAISKPKITTFCGGQRQMAEAACFGFITKAFDHVQATNDCVPSPSPTSQTLWCNQLSETTKLQPISYSTRLLD